MVGCAVLKTKWNKYFKQTGNEDIITLEDKKEKIAAIKQKLRNFKLERIFNFDETAFFYQQRPVRTLTIES